MKTDPGEQTELSAQHPEKAKELAAAWQRWNAELADPLWGPLMRARKKGSR